MKYEITVSPEVAALGDGTRRRHVTLGKKRKLLTFSARPTTLDELPPEIADDPHLRVRKIAPAKVEKSGKGKPSSAAKENDGGEAKPD